MNKTVTEEILTQKMTIAEVIVYRNYSNIDNNPYTKYRVINTKEGLDVFINKITEDSTTSVMDNKYRAVKVKEKTYNQYFNSDNGLLICDLTYITSSNHGKNFITDTDKRFFKYYKNPFAYMKIYNLYRKIKRKNNIITISYYIGVRVRNVNNRFFIKKKMSRTISFDLKNGNFYTSVLLNKKFKVRTNDFNGLREFIENFKINNKVLFLHKINLLKYELPSRITKQYTEVFNDCEFNNQVKNLLGIDFNFDKVDECKKQLMDFVVKNKKLKVNNDYYQYLERYYPNIKILGKKHIDYNLNKGILESKNLNYKFFQKLMNKYSDININVLKSFCENILLNDYGKYLSAMTDKTINNFFRGSAYYSNAILRSNWMNNITYSSKQKSNIIKILNESSEGNSKQSFSLDILDDHIRMLVEIKRAGVNYDFNAHSLKTFTEEHELFSKITTIIRAGTIKTLVYDNTLLNEIEQPITYTYENEEIVITPIILKTSLDYDDEGRYMRHCVGGYISNESSLIISFRSTNKDRVTCEYNNITGICKQQRYFCNGEPPEYFNYALNKIKTKLLNLSVKSNLKPIDVVNKQVEINGVKIPFREQLIGQTIDGIFNDALNF